MLDDSWRSAYGSVGHFGQEVFDREAGEAADKLIDEKHYELPDMDKEKSRAILEQAPSAKIAASVCAKALADNQPELKIEPIPSPAEARDGR